MSVAGAYKITLNTPMGAMDGTLTIKDEEGEISGSLNSQLGDSAFKGGTAEGNKIQFNIDLNAMGTQISMVCEATVDGDSIKGMMNSAMGGAEFSGKRES